jgi:hypothetical protein
MNKRRMLVVIRSHHSSLWPPERVEMFFMTMVLFKQRSKLTVSLFHFILICWLLSNAHYLAQPENVKSKRSGKGRGKNTVPLDPDGINMAHIDSNGKALIIIQFHTDDYISF